MTVRLRAARVDGRVHAPGSKSHTHRAFILGALAGNGSIQNPLLSVDTQATLDGLQRLGFLATVLPHETRVGGTFRAPKQPLDARESGTTLRLLSAFATLAPFPTRFTALEGLARRPMAPLLDALRTLGARVDADQNRPPFTVQGPLRGGPATMRGDVSSQFVSALLLAAPRAPTDTFLTIDGPLASRPYVDLTLNQLAHHGVRVDEDKGTFHVRGDQKVRQKPYAVPGDYSSAAFLLSAAAITGGTIHVDGLRPDDPQGDRAILDHLRAFGAHVAATADTVTVTGNALSATDIDVGRIPDLFPILCVVAACARGTSRLVGAPHLRAKETDRIRAMATNLAAAGIKVEERPDGLTVHGSQPRGVTIESHQDHRIAMAMSVLALAAKGDSVLPDESVVDKSYPAFFTDLRRVAPEVTVA